MSPGGTGARGPRRAAARRHSPARSTGARRSPGRFLRALTHAPAQIHICTHTRMFVSLFTPPSHHIPRQALHRRPQDFPRGDAYSRALQAAERALTGPTDRRPSPPSSPPRPPAPRALPSGLTAAARADPHVPARRPTRQAFGGATASRAHARALPARRDFKSQRATGGRHVLPAVTAPPPPGRRRGRGAES